MLTIQRRSVLGALAGLGMAAPLWAQSAPKGKLAPKLRIVIPAMSRTALDEAGRALGDALVGQGLSDEIEYENKEGGSGTAGLAWYVQKYNADPNTFFMGDSNLVGALALQKPAVDLGKVKPVARLTSDYPVVVVAAASPLKTINELVERLRTNAKQTSMYKARGMLFDRPFPLQATASAIFSCPQPRAEIVVFQTPAFSFR